MEDQFTHRKTWNWLFSFSAIFHLIGVSVSLTFDRNACGGRRIFKRNLKLASTSFYQIFVFPTIDNPSKTMKRVFYFIKKALFVPRYSNFCNFSFHFTLSRYNRTNRSGIICDVSWIGLHKSTDVIFEITQQLFYITLSTFVK